MVDVIRCQSDLIIVRDSEATCGSVPQLRPNLKKKIIIIIIIYIVKKCTGFLIKNVSFFLNQ